MRPVPRIEGLVVGLSLAAVGLLWTLSNFGRLDLLATLRTWWPSVVVFWGLLELYNSRAVAAARRAAPLPPPPTAEARWWDAGEGPGRPE